MPANYSIADATAPLLSQLHAHVDGAGGALPCRFTVALLSGVGLQASEHARGECAQTRIARLFLAPEPAKIAPFYLFRL